MTCKKNICNSIMDDNMQYFKEEMIENTLIIPEDKPDLSRILDIAMWAEIESFKLIETQKGYSYEGQKLTGYKLVAEVKISEKLTYVSNEICESTHAIYYEKIKSIFIVLPEEINGRKICELDRADKIKVNPYIEDRIFRKISDREIHRCLLLLLDVQIC